MEQDYQYQAVQKPSVWGWFVLYCVLLALMYLMCMAIGVFFALAPSFLDMTLEEGWIAGSICLLMGFIFFVPFVIGPFLPAKPWAWIFGLILICLGMTSCCILPFAIPLLIYWIKPENQEYYGRK